MELRELYSEAEQYQKYAELTCSNEVGELIDRITTLNVYTARTGHMLAEAKQLLNRKRTSEISDVILKIAKENHLSAKAQNALVESIAADEQYLVDWLERLNRALTHQASNCVSILSFEREQLRVLKSGY